MSEKTNSLSLSVYAVYSETYSKTRELKILESGLLF